MTLSNLLNKTNSIIGTDGIAYHCIIYQFLELFPTSKLVN